MTQRTVPVSFLRAAVSTALHRGVDVNEWMTRLDIDADLLVDDRSRITVEQATHVIQDVWRQTDDEMGGLGRKPVPRGTFRMMTLGVLSSPDLGTVLERFGEFSRVLPGLPEFDLEVADGRARVRLDTQNVDDPAHFLTDVALAVGLRFFGWLVGRRLAIESVELPYPTPAYVEDYDLVFGAPLAFDRPAAVIVFAEETLRLPVMRTEAELERWLRDSPADLLSVRDHASTTADQVRRILERGLRGDWPTADDVASRLAMSTQHLRRLLREQGTSMSRIKEDLLRDAAVTSLVRGEESVADLSERLGFSEPSAFHRAFRRWTGSAPGAYRPRATPSD